MRGRSFLALAILASLQPVWGGGSFSLEQISSSFPSRGLEKRISFWREMFTRYSEREVVFHDRQDLGLIYQVVRFPRGVRGDRAEFRRQRSRLRARARHLEKILGELGRWGPASKRLGAEHHKMLERLTSLGYTPSRHLFRRLAQQVRYQRGIREKFREGLIRSGRYLARMEEEFRSRHLPVELALLPHVESSFDYHAYSHRGAAGIWQFMWGTGRPYLRITRYLDERLDPLAATRAAARLLEENYRMLGNWPLAITAFNHGRNGMLRARRQYGEDLGTIIEKYQSRLFGFASKNFYSEFLAAVEVAKNAQTYFGPFQPDAPLEFDEIRLPHSYRIAQVAQAASLSEQALWDYNPQIRPRVWKRSRVLPAGLHVRIPKQKKQSVLAQLRKTPPLPARLQVASDGSLRYRVRRGDTLSDIARRFGTSIRRLARANAIRDRDRIYPGQWLALSASGSSKPTRYQVRSGDTLIKIARRFGVSIEGLMAANRIPDRDRIVLGQVLRIP